MSSVAVLASNRVPVADLPALIKTETMSGDLVVLLGAGDITTWAYALPGQLEALNEAAA